MGSIRAGYTGGMAREALRLAHNHPGDFYVDSSCIDCDTCRWMAPTVFTQRQDQASVWRQPGSKRDLQRALMALVSCPTASIGTVEKHDVRAAMMSLPELIEDGVYHCGYHSESSFGAASYLIVREGGNILVDSPRFTRPLVRRLEELGGVRTMFLTHRDDVADHGKFHSHFRCERVMHERDASGSARTIERRIEGRDPVRLDGEVVLIPVPGHTPGSTCLLYRDRFLFSGDHLAWSESLERVYAFRSACWFDWNELVRSTTRLSSHRFEWILPGHGRRCHFPRRDMVRQIELCLEWMRSIS